jgi:hypothetical protein
MKNEDRCSGRICGRRRTVNQEEGLKLENGKKCMVKIVKFGQILEIK